MPKDASATQTPMSYATFKPKFPLDPFTEADLVPTARPQWTLDTDALPALPILQAERRVFLIIGQPSTLALEPLLHSLQLSSSLLIIASHRPPTVPVTTQPAVRILRLRAPIAVEDAGASRLVDVLEWAEQVARLWRRNSNPRIQELTEEASTPEPPRTHNTSGRIRYSVVLPSSTSTPISPLSSQPNLSADRPQTSKSSSSLLSMRRQSNASLALSLPPADPGQRPFDALLNFLPGNISDKAILKSAILVTTLARPYLVAAAVRAPATRFWSENAKMTDSSGASVKSSNRMSRRWSIFRGTQSAMNSTTSVNDDAPKKFERRDRSASFNRSLSQLSEMSRSNKSIATIMAIARLRKSRIIHLLPSTPLKLSQAHLHPNSNALQAAEHARAHLIRSIEAFLLSFSFPLPTPVHAPNNTDYMRARPYILPVSSLSDVISVTTSPSSPTSPPSSPVDDYGAGGTMQSEWSLAELLLCGALDHETEPDLSSSIRDLVGGKDKSGSEKAALVLSEVARGKMKEAEAGGFVSAYEWMAHRAWLGGLTEVQIKPKEGVQAQVRTTKVQQTMQLQIPTPPKPAKAGVKRKPVSAAAKQDAPGAKPAVKKQDGTPATPGKATVVRKTTAGKQGTKLAKPVAPALGDKRLPTPPDENTAAGSQRPPSVGRRPSQSKPLAQGQPIARVRSSPQSHPGRAPSQKRTSTPVATSPTASSSNQKQPSPVQQTPGRSKLAADSGLPTPPDSEEASFEGDLSITLPRRHPAQFDRPRVGSEPSPSAPTPPSSAPAPGSPLATRPPPMRVPSRRNAPTPERPLTTSFTERKPAVPEKSFKTAHVGASSSTPMLSSLSAGEPSLHKKRSKWKFWKLLTAPAIQPASATA